MLPGLRVFKRFLIAFIAVGVVVVVVLYGTRYFQKPVPTPTPDPRDQLKALQVLSVQVLPVSSSDYDVVARIQNPNTDYGSGDVEYTLLFDTTEVYHGSLYILPGQTKYIVITPVKAAATPAQATIKITSIKWQELDTLSLAGVNFVVTNASYLSNQSDIFARLRGFVANNSDFDVARVDVAILLFDDKDKIVAVNRTEIHTFLAHTTRGFETSWFTKFPGTVARTYVEANTNLFAESGFIRTYGGQERFQTF